jgi:hypothetical protein
MKSCVVVVDQVRDAEKPRNALKQSRQPWKELLFHPDHVIPTGAGGTPQPRHRRTRYVKKAIAAARHSAGKGLALK